jgi:DNA-binding transcriptional ArsR family regulator
MLALIKTHSTAECDDRKRKILKLDSHSTRGKQLKALRKILIPPISLEVKKRNGLLEFKKPTGQLLKAVLRAVDDHGTTCFASEKTLAQEVNCSERSIRTGLTALEKLGLISLSRRGKQNRYHIVWETIFEILDAQPPMEDESDLELSSENLELSSENLELSSENLELSSDISDVLSDTLNETSSEKKKRARASTPPDPYLLEICEWWNQLHSQKLVLSGVSTAPPSQAVLRAWKKINADKTQLARFQDLDALKTAIQGSDFSRPWLTLAKLMGTNSAGELIAEKLIAGCYGQHQSQPSRPSRVNMGPGVIYDPATKGKSKW